MRPPNRNTATFCDRTGQVQEGTTPELKSLVEANSLSLAQLGVKQADLEAEKKELAPLEDKNRAGIHPAVTGISAAADQTARPRKGKNAA